MAIMGYEERNYGIDFLKTLGLLLIILAHISAPQWINQIRNFDVPLMVFLSGCLSRGSVARSSSYFSYVKKTFTKTFASNLYISGGILCYTFLL